MIRANLCFPQDFFKGVCSSSKTLSTPASCFVFEEACAISQYIGLVSSLLVPAIFGSTVLVLLPSVAWASLFLICAVPAYIIILRPYRLFQDSVQLCAWLIFYTVLEPTTVLQGRCCCRNRQNDIVKDNIDFTNRVSWNETQQMSNSSVVLFSNKACFYLM